jgi:hypothetical protein
MPDITKMTTDEIAEYLETCKKADMLEAGSWPKTLSMYMHRDKESNYDLANQIGLDDDATQNFKYMGTELQISIIVQRDGSTVATHVDGVLLDYAVKLS